MLNKGKVSFLSQWSTVNKCELHKFRAKTTNNSKQTLVSFKMVTNECLLILGFSSLNFCSDVGIVFSLHTGKGST